MMAVNYVTIKEYIKDGKLEYELPENVTEGAAEITVPIVVDEDELTAEELGAYLKFKGLPLSEVEVGGWEDMGIEDSVQFIEALRRKSWRKFNLE